MGLQFIVLFSVQEKMGLLVGRDHLIFSLYLPSSAHLSASSFRGSPRWALFFMKTVSSPCSIRSRRSRTISLMMSSSGLPHVERDFPLPIHFWEEVMKQAKFNRRLTGFKSCFHLASSNARHPAPSSALFDEFPSFPLPSWQPEHPPLFSSNVKIALIIARKEIM